MTEKEFNKYLRFWSIFIPVAFSITLALLLVVGIYYLNKDLDAHKRELEKQKNSLKLNNNVSKSTIDNMNDDYTFFKERLNELSKKHDSLKLRVITLKKELATTKVAEKKGVITPIFEYSPMPNLNIPHLEWHPGEWRPEWKDSIPYSLGVLKCDTCK